MRRAEGTLRFHGQSEVVEKQVTVVDYLRADHDFS